MASTLRTCANPQSPPADGQRPPSSVRPVVLHGLERLAVLAEDSGSWRAEHERLREQPPRSARHSAPPPSRDTPRVPPRQQRQSRGRQRGAQPGHAGQQRPLSPVGAGRRGHEHRPGPGRACGTAWSGDEPPPVRHPVVEWPAVQPLVEEQRWPQQRCPACGAVPRAAWRAEGSARGDGPGLVATVGVRSGPYRQSARQTQPAWADVEPGAVAWGTRHQWRQEVAAALAAPVVEAPECAHAQAGGHAEEPGWTQGPSAGATPQRRKAWRGGRGTSGGTVCPGHLRRGQAAAKALRGEWSGSLLTARWPGDGGWPLSPRQVGGAPRSRACPQMAARGGASPALGAGGRAPARQLFGLWSGVRAGTGTRAGLAAAVVERRERSGPWRTAGAAERRARGETSARARTARPGRALLTVAPALWRCGRVAGIEPTNKAAARALRPAGSWRRTRLGTQSALGSQCVARMVTVTRTRRSQPRPGLAYLPAAWEAARQGLSASSLLPNPSLLEQELHCAIAA
jgi:hypothetical protein